MANDVAATSKHYGGLKPAGTVGADEFAAHDHTKAWADNGASQAMVESIANDILSLHPEIRAYGAQQAKEAVMDYASNSFGDICVVEGRLCFLLDVSNNAASFGVFWKLEDLLQKTIAEAENAGDEATLKAIGTFLTQLQNTFRPPVAAIQPQAARALRPGNTKQPAGGANGARGGRFGGARLPAPEKAPA